MSDAQPGKSASKFQQMLAGGARPKPAAVPAPTPAAAVAGPATASPAPARVSPEPPATPDARGNGAPSPAPAPPPRKRDQAELRKALSALTIDSKSRPESAPVARTPWLGMAICLIIGVGGTLLVVRYGLGTATAEKPTAGRSAQPTGAAVPPPAQGPAAAPGTPVYEGSGKIVSDRRVNVATKVSGQIVEMLVEQGDRVKAGDVIAKIEDINYKAMHDQALGQFEAAKGDVARARAAQVGGKADYARAEVEVARADMAVLAAKAKLSQLKALQTFLDWNADRVAKLNESKMAGEVEKKNTAAQAEAQKAAIEAAEAEVRASEKSALTARAGLDVIKAQMAAQVADVDRAEAGVDAAEAFYRLQSKRLADCVVTAPIGGVILERNAQVGDFVAAEGGVGGSANAQFVTIADTDRLRVEVDVNERDVKLLSPNMPCRIAPAADPGRGFDGYIMWIDPGAKYDKAQVQVKVRILQPDETLKIEGAAAVQFGVGTGHPPATQPASAPN